MPCNGPAHWKSLGGAQEREDDNTRSQRNEHRRHAKEQQCTHRHRLATDPITERAGQDACDRHPAQRRVDRDADLRWAGVKRDREWRCNRLRFKEIHEYEKTRQRHEKLDPCRGAAVWLSHFRHGIAAQPVSERVGRRISQSAADAPGGRRGIDLHFAILLDMRALPVASLYA